MATDRPGIPETAVPSVDSLALQHDADDDYWKETSSSTKTDNGDWPTHGSAPGAESSPVKVPDNYAEKPRHHWERLRNFEEILSAIGD